MKGNRFEIQFMLAKSRQKVNHTVKTKSGRKAGKVIQYVVTTSHILWLRLWVIKGIPKKMFSGNSVKVALNNVCHQLI